MKYWASALIVIAFAACTRDIYDSGDGKYSYLRADFVEAHSDKNAAIDYVITDDGDSLSMPTPFTNKYITAKDSIYRGVFYYNIITGSDGTSTVCPVSYSTIPVRYTVAPSDTLKYDPMGFESLWCSRTGKYINVSVTLYTAQVNGSEGRHTLYLVRYPNTETIYGKRKINLVFSHNQNGIPEYYNSSQYVSIPVSQFGSRLQKGDSISVSVMTNNGWERKEILY